MISRKILKMLVGLIICGLTVLVCSSCRSKVSKPIYPGKLYYLDQDPKSNFLICHDLRTSEKRKILYLGREQSHSQDIAELAKSL
jgi:hypothetical protein